MKFLVDRCAGRRLAEWLAAAGHDVVESRSRGPDPGDLALLAWAVAEERILVTIDTDFGKLVFVEQIPHCGIVRLPDVPPATRIILMKDIVDRHHEDLSRRALITVRGTRIRVSMPQPPAQTGDPGVDTPAS